MNDEPEVKEWDAEWMVRRGSHITLITPELAQEFLSRNTNNRKTKKAAIDRYAAEMQAGRWDPDASDIKFARTGELIDGQNRLWACIKAGVPFPTMVRTGLSLDTKRRVDIGVKRTISDTFQMERVPYANNIAAAINLRLRYEDAEANGLRLDASPSSRRRVVALSPDAALEYLRAHPEHEKVGLTGERMYRVGPAISRSVYFAFLAMAAAVDENDQVRFAAECLDEAPPSGPVMAFIRYLAGLGTAGLKRSGSLVQERNASDKHLTALITAWNAWRMDEQLPRLVVRDTDPFVPIV